VSSPTENSQSRSKTIYVTRTGLPLSFDLEWPFRPATSGADFHVLHTIITLENSDSLRALVAVNLSATLREVFASLDAKDTEGPVINALRKEVDRKQTEFAKSSKLVPLPLSSRHYNFKLRQWVFGKASDEEIARLIERKVFWQARLSGREVWLEDPIESLYLETTPHQILAIAGGLAQRGLIALAEGKASARPALMDQAERFESEMSAALRQLEEKHAFERG
jgi:hypothetical protein